MIDFLIGKPVANAKIQTTQEELQREKITRRVLSRRTTRLALLLDDHRRQDEVLRR